MTTKFHVHLKKLVLEKSAKSGERITQKDVEEATGLSAVTIRRWYTGEVARVEADTVGRLTRYLGVGMHELLTIEGAQ